MMSAAAMNSDANPYKRPASPMGELAMPPAKVPKTSAGQISINYLKREKKETMPLATAEETLPRLLRLMQDYDGVLQRHESLAGNLGACPVGPILLKRFERLFEGPPRILKSNSRDPNITWLDVVEFAQNKPEQFDLEKSRNGIRVCQFYLKQCRVEISEEDYVLIRSGMPQKLIPPQPILEDEEKELGVIEVLDRNLAKVIQSADSVSARARQLVHRLKNRRTAILSRREVEGDSHRSVLRSNDLPPSPAFEQRAFEHNGAPSLPKPATSQTRSPSFQSGGFTAVNPRHSLPSAENPLFHTPRHEHEPAPNGTPLQHHHVPQERPLAQPTENWMDKFLKPSERAAGMTAETIRRETMSSTYRSSSRGEMVPAMDDALRMNTAGRRDSRRQSEGAIPVSVSEPQPASVAIPNTPSSLIPQQKPNTWNRDDGGPYKAEMISRMETMKRGERVIPPCDRCRRLHMDCIKNLTACLGCTKKHAKCSWKDVTLEELESTAPAARERAEKESEHIVPSSSDWDNILKQTKDADELGRVSPQSATASAPGNDPMEVSSNKASTPQVPSPQNGHGLARAPSHHHESPRLDVRPPPLDQQLRDAAEGKAAAAADPPYPTSRFSPFQRLPSNPQSQQACQHHYQRPSPPQHHQQPPSSPESQYQHHPQHHHPSHPPRARKEEPVADEGDRLAAVAAQVYRSQSQNAARASETAS